MAGFELAEAPDQRVELAVGKLGSVELVVEPVVVRNHRALITVEQGAEGGFGAIVLHELARRGAFDRGLAIRTVCLPDRFIEQASPAGMYADAGINRKGINNSRVFIS